MRVTRGDGSVFVTVHDRGPGHRRASDQRADLREVRPRRGRELETRHRPRALHRPLDRGGARRVARGLARPPAGARPSRCAACLIGPCLIGPASWSGCPPDSGRQPSDRPELATSSARARRPARAARPARARSPRRGRRRPRRRASRRCRRRARRAPRRRRAPRALLDLPACDRGRVPDAGRRRAAELGRVEAVARLERLAQQLRLAHPVEPEAAARSRSTSQVWTYQCGSRRSIEYGSTVRVDGTSSLLGFRYSISTSAVLRDRLGSACRRDPPRRRRAARGSASARTAPNVSSSLARTRSSGECAPAAIIGPTNSSARRIARASSGVSRGGRRNVSPKSSLSTCTSSPCSSA